MGGGPFIIPQQIFDFSTIPILTFSSGVQDSNLVACPNGVFTQLLILTDTSKWFTLFVTIGGLTNVIIATGAAGFEVTLFNLVLPATVNFMNAMDCPLKIPAGTRISCKPNAGGCSAELHVLF